MRLIVVPDGEALALAAATLVRERVAAAPELALAVPAGRTPRRMYARLRELQQGAPLDYGRLHVFSVDELCPPAPADGYFWRQVGEEFLAWAGVDPERQHPFRVDAADLQGMCRAYDQTIASVGGLDLVVLGLGPNAHIASNEPGTPFDAPTRPVRLLDETVGYILTDEINLARAGGAVSAGAVTLGLRTILEAREVVVLVSGASKREPLGRLVDGPVTEAAPASVLQRHPRCTVLADRDARPSQIPHSPDI